MNLMHPEIKQRLGNWQNELKQLTGNDTVLIVAFHPPLSGIDILDLTKIVCEETGIPLTKITSRNRKRDICVARQALAYFAEILTDMSLKQIGDHVGGRDHTTVIHARRKISDGLQSNDRRICTVVKKINKRLEERNNETH